MHPRKVYYTSWEQINAILNLMGNLLLDLLFPARCFGCKRVGKYLCSACQKTFIIREYVCPICDRPAISGATHPGCRRPQGLDGLTCVFKYERVMKKAIKTLKYRFVSDAAQTLIMAIPEVVFANVLLQSKDMQLFPIPLHRERLKWRGFNQAEALGKIVARKLEIPLVANLLIRTHKRTPQADIKERQVRIENAHGLFSINKSSQIPRKLILFDDVWTTGATMSEACKVLKRNGVQWVWGMTLAR